MPMGRKKAKKGAARKGAAKKGAKKRGAAKKGARRAAPKKRAVAKKKKTARKKTVRKAAKKKTARKKAAKKGGRRGGAGNAAFMRPVQPSAALAEVIGNRPMPRTEVTKKVWEYIRANRLQDSVNRRMVNADDKLRVVFGGKRQVSMFEMTKLISNHLS